MSAKLRHRGRVLWAIRLFVLGVMLPGSLQARGLAPLRVGIISLAPPAKVHAQWQAFADYLAAKIGRDVRAVVPRGFDKIQQAVTDRQVDIFYVNSHIFYALKQQGKALPIAQMQNLDGKITSRSVFFVRGDSGIDAVQQLKGEKLAYISPAGAGGYLAPRAFLYEHGVDELGGVQEQFTKNLSSSIHKVLLGDVKAGTMCGLNYELMSRRLATGDLKIIGESDEYPENTFGGHPDLPADLRAKVAAAIIGMHDDPEGEKILDGMRGMKIRKFIAYDEKTEQITARLFKQARL